MIYTIPMSHADSTAEHCLRIRGCKLSTNLLTGATSEGKCHSYECRDQGWLQMPERRPLNTHGMYRTAVSGPTVSTSVLDV